jgi:hypothetical protein
MIAIISPAILVGIVAAALLLVRVLRIGMRPKGYAPGPPTFPIIGNLHQIPSRDLHIQFEKWAKECAHTQGLFGEHIKHRRAFYVIRPSRTLTLV